MQESCAGANLPRRVGVAEHLIHFKSSPNFKNMKKFIRSKMDRNEISDVARAPPPPPPDIYPEKKTDVQPPLPPVPPPPDSPWNVSVKQEVVDHEYIGAYGPYDGGKKPSQDQPQREDVKPRATICRDYVRGTCKRIGTCRYAHKFDISQLVGVYTFCRDFQTKVCKHANCKYVHADVFEEQNFYRTGYLPPHAFSHKRTTSSQSSEANSMSSSTSAAVQPPPPPPPLPPPPPPPPEEPVPEVSFKKPMTPLPKVIKQAFMPMRSLEESYLDLLSSHPLKRTWSSIESSSLLDHDMCDFPKKCKHCDIMEFRLQHSRNKLQKMILNTEALGVKIAHIDKRNAKLESIIMKLLTSSSTPTSPKPYAPSPFNRQYNREFTQLEQLSALLDKRLEFLGKT
ncbi:formin-binding protein 4-like [Zerene cesonia]|uniref:formin-binding protein 4-like n=1 Tax=Zerene cesonia TaxID=33412 RepID=UPI0018E4F9C1|nr:formin-binding protein 4-like [Zerene cesonia]